MAAVHCVLVAGCADLNAPSAGAAGDVNSPCSVDAVSLEITPALADVEVGDARRAAVQYRAVATFVDGSMREVPAHWSFDLPGAGALDEHGLLTLSGDAGGDGEVRARVAGFEATSRLGVRLVQRLVVDVDPTIVDRFDDSLPRDKATAPPRFVEPTSGTIFPSDATDIALRWDGADHEYFRIRFLSSSTDISIYTRGDGHRLDIPLRRALADSNRGRRIAVSLEAADAAQAIVHRTSGPLEIGFCSDTDLCASGDDDCDSAVDEDCTVTNGAPAISCSDGTP